MFDGNADAAARGPLAVAVPGELKGYWEMYQRFGGGVPWARLVQPTIDICEQGFQVSAHAGRALAGQSERIKNTPSMSIFLDNRTGEVYLENDTMTRPDLAATFRIIAQSSFGGNELYMDTQLMRNFVSDLKGLGGIIEHHDMMGYS